MPPVRRCGSNLCRVCIGLAMSFALVMKMIVIGEATSGTSSPATLFHIVVRRWQVQMARLFDPYRPERHYMRGPGPKWREKHVCL